MSEDKVPKQRLELVAQMSDKTYSKRIPVLGTQGECIGLFEILTEYMEALDVMRYCLEFAYDMKTREIVHVSIRYLQPIERKCRYNNDRRILNSKGTCGAVVSKKDQTTVEERENR